MSKMLFFKVDTTLCCTEEKTYFYMTICWLIVCWKKLKQNIYFIISKSKLRYVPKLTWNVQLCSAILNKHIKHLHASPAWLNQIKCQSHYKMLTDIHSHHMKPFTSSISSLGFCQHFIAEISWFSNPFL